MDQRLVKKESEHSTMENRAETNLLIKLLVLCVALWGLFGRPVYDIAQAIISQ